MARHESDFSANADAALSLEELLTMLSGADGGDEQSREKAIVCFLSGADGWNDAVKALRGTFAGTATGLSERKSD